MKTSLAGHEFNTDQIDCQCVNKSNVPENEQCRVTRAYLFQVTDSDVGGNAFAHISPLTSSEYNEIVTERNLYNQHCERIMSAIRDVCSG